MSTGPASNVFWVTDDQTMIVDSGGAMARLEEFQSVARESGFVGAKECDDGTVLWLKRETSGAATKTLQRLCMDSLTNSATVYWMSSTGKLDSKTFRSVSSLQEWIALDPIR